MSYIAILEKLGRFFFTNNRCWLFFGLLIAPFLLALSILAPRFFLLRDTEKMFDAASLRGRTSLEKRQEKEAFLKKYVNSESYFIDQRLETLPLLSKNLEELKAMKNHPACKNREAANQRIAFLEGPENRLSFAEENIHSSKRIKETEERLTHPIELNTDDLSQLLSLIENVPIGDFCPDPQSPQLLIQDFTLSRKDRGIYQLQINLLKREFIQPDEKTN